MPLSDIWPLQPFYYLVNCLSQWLNWANSLEMIMTRSGNSSVSQWKTSDICSELTCRVQLVQISTNFKRFCGARHLAHCASGQVWLIPSPSCSDRSGQTSK
eukprot:6212168-Pleurochrysis_carterae.AAC.5